MTDEAFDRWLKRNRHAGWAAINLSRKRAVELRIRHEGRMATDFDRAEIEDALNDRTAH